MDYPPKLKKLLKKQGKLPTKSSEEREKASLEALEEMKEVLNNEDKEEFREFLKENNERL